MPATALVLLDLQANMFAPAAHVASAGALIARLSDLVDRARAAGVPVVFIRNCGKPGDPDVKGSVGWQLYPPFEPRAGERVLDKTTLDAFASTDLGRELRARGVTRLVIAGLQSEFCVRETTLGALAHGFSVVLVEDGHSTFDGKTQTAGQISAGINAELKGRVTLVRAGDLRFD